MPSTDWEIWSETRSTDTVDVNWEDSSKETANEEGQILISIKSTNQKEKKNGPLKLLKEMNFALDSAKNLTICIGHHRPTTPQPPLNFCPIPVNNLTPDFMSNASDTTRGFPLDCFYIRAAGTQRYWTLRWGETHQDGNGIDLDWFAKPNHEQTFFVNSSGNLCCMGSGGIAVDVIGNSLIIAHNRPFTRPWPNPWSHPLPTFTYSRDTQIISVKFYVDPIPSATWPRSDSEWKDKEYVIAARCRKGSRIPRFNDVKPWAPDNPRFSKRWTSRAGHCDEPGVPNNLGIEERASVGRGDEERIQWVLESA